MSNSPVRYDQGNLGITEDQKQRWQSQPEAGQAQSFFERIRQPVHDEIVAYTTDEDSRKDTHHELWHNQAITGQVVGDGENHADTVSEQHSQCVDAVR